MQHGEEKFAEVELEEWLARALEVGMEHLVAVYLRAVVGRGEELVFPFMGEEEEEVEEED